MKSICCEKVRGFIAKLDWLPALLSRLTIGFIFIQTGWGKLTHLDKVAAFFESIGIPAARLQAPFVASVEFGCGILVLLGLGTRLAAIPLIGVMLVAIKTVKLQTVTELSDFLSFSEYLFIVLLLWLVVKGAGCASVDFFLWKRCGEKTSGGFCQPEDSQERSSQ